MDRVKSPPVEIRIQQLGASLDEAVLREAFAEAVRDAVGRKPSGVVRCAVGDDLLSMKLGRGSRSRRLSRRRSRSARAWDCASVMNQALPCLTPAPRALIERRASAGWVDADAYVYDWSSGVTLDQAMGSSCPFELARLLAEAVHCMHARNVTHRDLKASNVLIEEGAGGAIVRFIDLDGARVRSAPPSPQRRARDLARLALSLRLGGADPEALVDAYAQQSGAAPRDIERMRRRVSERVERWLRRSKRPLA